ncbi:MAG: response regulator [Actinomycetota bacterium]
MTETRHVLLVEDEPADQALIRSAFQRIGSEATLDVVPNVSVAIDRLGRDPRPVIAIVDLNLPGESGLELVEWMRATNSVRSVPIVVLSGSDDRTVIRTSYEAGANAYLVKPQSLDEVDELVRRIDSFWLGACALADDPR